MDSKLFISIELGSCHYLTIKDLCSLSTTDKQANFLVTEHFKNLFSEVDEDNGISHYNVASLILEYAADSDISQVCLASNIVGKRGLLKFFHPRTRESLLEQYHHDNINLTVEIARRFIIEVKKFNRSQIGPLENFPNEKFLSHVFPWAMNFLIQMPELERSQNFNRYTRHCNALGTDPDTNTSWVLLQTGEIWDVTAKSTLISASMRGNLELVKLILKTGKVSDEYLNFSIVESVKYSYEDPSQELHLGVIKLLLSTQKISAFYKQRAIQYATHCHRDDIVALLKN